MVKIRLQRAGAKKRPFYRVIAIDERCARDGRALEFLGTYDPMTKPPKIRLQGDRIGYWRGHGAQMSPAVRSLVRRSAKLGPVEEPAAAAPAVPAAAPEAPADA